MESIIKKNKKISIIVPTFNEERNIQLIVENILIELKNFDLDYEIIFIDNCSTDNTQQEIELQTKKNKNIKAIFNLKNYGSIRSSQHGILQSSGDATILISADLQEPINLISDYIKNWTAGYDIVFAQKNKSSEGFFINFIKKFYYKFLKLISKSNLIENGGSTMLISKIVVSELKKIKDPSPYLRGMILEISSNVKIISYNQEKRIHGQSKTNFMHLYDTGMTGLIKHTILPRILVIFGFTLSLLSVVIAIFFLVYKIFYWDNFDVGVAPIIIGLFIFMSFQFLLSGLICEYALHTLTEVRKLPLVHEKKRINF